MILLRQAKRIAHDSGRGMALPGLYSGCFLFGASRTACIATCSGSLPNELAKVPNVAVQMGRKFVGAELKASYYRQAVANLKNAIKQGDLLEAA